MKSMIYCGPKQHLYGRKALIRFDNANANKVFAQFDFPPGSVYKRTIPGEPGAVFDGDGNKLKKDSFCYGWHHFGRNEFRDY